jgi:hypothetical protein
MKLLNSVKACCRRPLLVLLFVLVTSVVSVALLLEMVSFAMLLKIMKQPDQPVYQPDRKDYVLALTIQPTKITRSDFLRWRGIEATVYFTNDSTTALEFMTNGGSCFQFLDISVVGQDGKNHVKGKVGDMYAITPIADKRVVLGFGDTRGGTVVIPVGDEITPGEYKVQAFLTYQDLSVSSNVVRLVIRP